MSFRLFTPPSSTVEFASTPSFINRVIEAATEHYVRGNIYAKDHPKVNDSTFIRNTNQISDSSFIASTGPKNISDTIQFIEDTAFRDPPIEYIVALGDRLCELDHCTHKADFLNYFIGDETLSFGPYRISIKKKSGNASNNSNANEIKPDVFIESELTIRHDDETRKMTIIGLELKDCKAIKLDDDADNVKKEILWKIFKISLDNPVLVHCKHGRGRTGHLILTLEILKHYSSIFSSDDPEIVATNVLNLLTHIREQRPGLVHTKKQLQAAIRNAYTLRCYALENSYELSLEPNIKGIANA